MVDWGDLSRGWSSCRSPQWLRGKWWNLKRNVPDAHSLTFTEICAYLYKHHAQAVKEKLDEDSPLSSASELTRASLNIPRVSVMQASGILHTVPLRVQTEVQSSTVTTTTADEDSMIPELGTSFQTFEVLPSNVHLTHSNQPATFLIAPAQTTIPFASCASNSAGQIIIQALPADTLHGSDDVTVQMTMPSQIIISTGGGPATTLASLGATGLTTPIHLTRPLLQTNLHIDSLAAQAARMLTSVEAEELLSSQMNENKLQDRENSMASQTDIISQGLDAEEEDRDDESSINQTSQETSAVVLETGSSHLILADPMLSSSNSPELIGGTVASEDDQQVLEDTLDNAET